MLTPVLQLGKRMLSGTETQPMSGNFRLVLGPSQAPTVSWRRPSPGGERKHAEKYGVDQHLVDRQIRTPIPGDWPTACHATP